MDTIQHAAWGQVIAAGIEQSLGVEPSVIHHASSIFIGALPDIIGQAERIVMRDSSRWQWYRWAHGVELDEAPRFVQRAVRILMMHPAYTLHLLLDQPTHGIGKRWWIFDEGLPLEVLGWIAVLIAYRVVSL